MSVFEKRCGASVWAVRCPLPEIENAHLLSNTPYPIKESEKINTSCFEDSLHSTRKKKSMEQINDRKITLKHGITLY